MPGYRVYSYLNKLPSAYANRFVWIKLILVLANKLIYKYRTTHSKHLLMIKVAFSNELNHLEFSASDGGICREVNSKMASDKMLETKKPNNILSNEIITTYFLAASY